ncbi:OLC1v1001088C1 [Oldenlandia corymbosa var. corymbosa]|uniref:OLC1v1001088C1 n=1 Tax=Oldenlandia corymbosa var. corymbosa TaxID=529605 RepID=A0AAV1D7H6_OLDCO|nr:OLC1v1001088C1 [Oldenlandia corymbosa var. corymbosa]
MENNGIQDSLLNKKAQYFDNCPGCKVDQLKEMQRGFPIKQFTTIWTIVLCAALPISSLFPFLYFMVRDFHVAGREEDINSYAGYVGAAYMLGRTLTSVSWGLVADRYGRKPVILLSIIAVIVFNTIFGLSVNYWMAISARFCLGAFNGLLGPIKAYATEIFRSEYQALALSAISTSWAIGLIIGPALGGFLAQPAEQYPAIFSSASIFGRFPYFLPCLVISAFAVVVVVSIYWLPETLHNHPPPAGPRPESYDALEAALQGSKEAQERQNTSSKSLFRNWPLMSSIIVYCIFSLHDMAYTEVYLTTM